MKELIEQNSSAIEDMNKGKSKHTGVFAGFVLLSKGVWDKQQFIQDMEEKWKVSIENKDKAEDTLVFKIDDMVVAISMMNFPIPNDEALINAENNYMWKDAVKVAKEHKAHLMVAVLDKKKELIDRGMLYTKILAACCQQKYTTGIYTSGVVFEPSFYEDCADVMLDGDLPIFNWIWFGLWQDNNGLNAYTYGMDVFGKDELEVLGANTSLSKLRDFISDIASYVLKSNVELQDGETIGFSAEDKHNISRSPSVGLPNDQMTLKISWESLNE